MVKLSNMFEQPYKLWVVAKREYLERVRSRWFLIGTLAVPLLVGISFFLPAYLAARATASSSVSNIIILDATGTDLGQRVARNLVADRAALGAADASEEIVRPVVRDVPSTRLAAAESLAVREAMQKNGRVGYLVLDSNTVAGVLARYAGRNASTVTDLERLRNAVRQSVMTMRLEHAGVDAATVRALSSSSLQLPAVRITEQGRGGSGAVSVMLGIGLAFLLYMSIIFHGQMVLRGVLEEKMTRVAEVVLSSVKPEVLLGGKVLGVGAVGLTQQILWIVITGYMIQRLTPLIAKMGGGEAAGASSAGFLSVLTGIGLGTLIWVLLFFAIGFTFYAALYAAAGSMVNSEQEAQQAAAPVIFLLVASIILAQPVILDPTGKLAVVLSWLPFSSPIIMPLRMTVIQLPVATKIGVLVVGLLGCALVVWFAARIYRVGMLMYGKKPSLRELARWIRYA